MNEQERINTLLKKYNLKAKKSFGQNFLINDGIIKRIVDRINVDEFENVIEIGPGLGSLTLPLSKNKTNIIAVDADKDMVMVLNDLVKNMDNVKIIMSDFLKFDPDLYSKKDKRLFIGNLPYNITSELIEYFFKKGFKKAGIMVQKEVADKLSYVKNKKNNCALGAFIKASGELNVLTIVDKSCFFPVPKVDSCFVTIDIKNEIDFSLYPVFKAIFKDPNKTISNCLKQNVIYRQVLDELSEEYRSFLSYRARQLDAQDILHLSEMIFMLALKKNNTTN